MSRRLELTTQTFQFGHSFDECYNRFVCTASSFGKQVVMPARIVSRL